MKKRFCKIIWLCAICVVLVLCGFFAIGEYFFNYTLVRRGETTQGARREVVSDVSEEDALTIGKNKETAQKISSEWSISSECEKLFINSDDGLNLIAMNFPNKNNEHKYAIVVHGYSNKKEDFYDLAYNYYSKGFSVLVPDLRAHGESEGQYVGMGWLDKRDLELWIDKVISIDPYAQIVLHGVSMGAATVMMTSGDILPNNVKAIVEDCGFTSVVGILSSELKKRYDLPAFPIIDFMALATYMHAGYNIFEASSTTQTSKSTLPLLIIHGDMDDFVPINMAYQIQQSSHNANLVVIEGAGHNECRFLQPETYYRELWHFLGINLNCPQLEYGT